MRELKPPLLLEGRLDLPGQRRRVPLFRPEHDIAALHIGRDVGKAEGFEEGLELRHLDDAVAADIDAGKQCDEDRPLPAHMMNPAKVSLSVMS